MVRTHQHSFDTAKNGQQALDCTRAELTAKIRIFVEGMGRSFYFIMTGISPKADRNETRN